MPPDTLNEELLAATLAQNPAGDLHVFAYGSLMWNPGFPHKSAAAARIFGYCRRLAIFSRRYRGTPQRPGLVLGLDCGGSCRGIAYRVARRQQAAVTRYLFEREMFADAYHPYFVRLNGGEQRALTFLARRDKDSYAPPMPEKKAIAIIRQASGIGGSNVDYLLNTRRHLRELGADSPTLARLCRQLS